MARLDVNLTGFKELSARLQQLAEKDGLSAAQSAVRAGGKILSTAVAKAAPVSDVADGTPEWRKGKDYPHRKISTSVVLKKVRTPEPDSVSVAVGDGKAFQASFVEFGTIHQAANPFIMDAFDQTTQPIVNAMRTTLDKQLVRRGG